MKLWKIVPLEKMGKYKVGDRVYSPHFGEGFITDIDEKASPTYPIVVEWTKELQPYHRHRDVYTIEGLYAVSYHDSGLDISKIKKDEETTTFGVWLNHARDCALMHLEKRKAGNKEKESGEGKEVKGNTKVEYSPINPSHYQVAGIPESIEIMEHLMTKEQLEGFLWGNILKYAYRYGRKGDKEETAGKIAWYAKKLEEVVGNAAV